MSEASAPHRISRRGNVIRDPRGKHALAKYNWIEKTITAAAVTLGFVTGEAPSRLMILIVLTNWLWIPFIVAYDVAQREALRHAVRPGAAMVTKAVAP